MDKSDASYIIIALVALGFLVVSAQPSSLASVDDVTVDNKIAKRITIPNLIGEVNVSAMASALKVKPLDLMNITVINHRGSGKVLLKVRVNVTRQRVRDSFDCKCVNIPVSVFDEKLGYNVTVMRESCDTCYSYENYTTTELVDLDPVNFIITKDTEIYEVFEGCDEFDWGCSVQTEVNLLGNKITGATWFNESFDECRNYSITSPVSSTLNSFSIYLNLTKDDDMLANYHDVRVINTSVGVAGHVVAHEFESTLIGYADMWVLMESLVGTINISVCYKNNTNVASGENITGVWNDGYIRVTHGPDKNTTAITESTSTAECNKKDVGKPAESITADKVYVGQDYDGGTDHVRCGSDADLPTGNDDRTIEFWTNSDVITAGDATFGYGTWSANDAFEIQTAASKFYLITHTTNHATNVTISTNTWYYFVITVVSGQIKAYVNDVLAMDTSGASMTTISGGHALLGTGPGGGDLSNYLGELRVSEVARSTDWVNASYQFMIDQAGLIYRGDEQEQVTDTCTYTSGNWAVTCSDNCSTTSDVDIGGNNISIRGYGTFHTTANITNFNTLTIIGVDGDSICTVSCYGGCFQ